MVNFPLVGILFLNLNLTVLHILGTTPEYPGIPLAYLQHVPFICIFLPYPCHISGISLEYPWAYPWAYPCHISGISLAYPFMSLAYLCISLLYPRHIFGLSPTYPQHINVIFLAYLWHIPSMSMSFPQQIYHTPGISPTFLGIFPLYPRHIPSISTAYFCVFPLFYIVD